MERDGAAATLLGSAIVQLDPVREPAVGVEYHRPSQLGDLTGTQTGFDREQHHDAITRRVSSTSRSAQRCPDLLRTKSFSLFAWHGWRSVFVGEHDRQHALGDGRLAGVWRVPTQITVV